MEETSESDDSDVIASLSYKRRQRRFFLAKVDGVSRHFPVDPGSDITVVVQSVAKHLKLRITLARSEKIRSMALALRQHIFQLKDTSGRKLFL